MKKQSPFRTGIEYIRLGLISMLGGSTGKSFDVFSGATSRRIGMMDMQGDVSEMVGSFRSIVFACIHARAKEVANRAKIVVRVKKANNEYADVPFTHPLAELMQNPNPYFTKYFLWYLTIAYLDLSGNSYWWVAKDRMRVPRELWPLPSQNVTIVPGNPRAGEGMIKSYVVNWGAGDTVEIPAEDVIHLKHPDPVSPYYYGGSLAMRAAYEIDTINFIQQFERDLYKESGLPPGILSFKNDLQKEVREAIKLQWREAGGRKPGRVVVLDGDTEYKPLLDQKELSYAESLGINRKGIQAVFGVPDSKIMISEFIEARATAETMDYVYQKETIEPLLTMLCEQLTLDLAWTLFDKNLSITHLTTIPKDVQAQAALDKENLAMGTRTINELRVRDGLEPIAGGDEPLVSAMLIPLSQVVATAAPEAKPPKEAKKSQPKLVKRVTPALPEKAFSDLSEGQKTALWKSHDRFRMQFESKMTRKLKKHFNEQKNIVLANIAASTTLGMKGEGNAFMFDLSRAIESLKALLDAESRVILQQAFDQFLRQYKIDDVLYAPNSPEVVTAIAKVNSKTRTIEQNLHDELLAQLDEGMRLNESQEDLSKRVNQFFDNTNDFRSVRIARTVSNYGVNAGNNIAASKSGVFNKKGWLTMRDASVRHLHSPMDGAEVGINEKFILDNGDALDVPGDPNANKAESVVNCRCTAFYSKAA